MHTIFVYPGDPELYSDSLRLSHLKLKCHLTLPDFSKGLSQATTEPHIWATLSIFPPLLSPHKIAAIELFLELCPSLKLKNASKKSCIKSTTAFTLGIF